MLAETIRYMLMSAGINVTEEDITAIQAHPYPWDVCDVLVAYAREDQARKAASQHATEAIRRRLERSNHGPRSTRT